MKREDLLAQGLQELHEGCSLNEVLRRYSAEEQHELEPLLRVGVHLQELPRNIAVSVTTKARLRAQLMAELHSPAPQPARFAWRNALDAVQEFFSPQTLRSLVLRPLGAAFSAFLAISLVGGSTVFAAMESIPGDNLYPVKTALEQARLTLNVTEEDKAETYLWMANTRVGELNKLVSLGRLEEAPNVIYQYEQSVSQALRFAAAKKDQESALQQQVSSVQTSLMEIYAKAPAAIQSILAKSLSLAAVFTPDQPNPAPTQSAQKNAPGTSSGAISDAGVGETPLPNAFPGEPSLPREKGDISTEPPPPAKVSPISNPPQDPNAILNPPTKGNLGPQPGPVSNSEVPPSSSRQEAETPKSEPLSPSGSGTDDLSTPKDLNSAATPTDKGASSLQGSSGQRPFPS